MKGAKRKRYENEKSRNGAQQLVMTRRLGEGKSKVRNWTGSDRKESAANNDWSWSAMYGNSPEVLEYLPNLQYNQLHGLLQRKTKVAQHHGRVEQVVQFKTITTKNTPIDQPDMEWNPTQYFRTAEPAVPYVVLILNQPINDRAFGAIREHGE